MKCPYCGDEDTRVIDSRPADDNTAIRRRRQCDVCGKRFTTYEKVEAIPLMVIKKDKSREPYDREKLVQGIIRSCHKRPVSMESIENCVNEIESEIYNMESREIDSTIIGSIVMDKIKNINVLDDASIKKPVYIPTVHNRQDGKVTEISKYAKVCQSSGGTHIYACPTTKRVKIFTEWDQEKYMAGKIGDYMDVRMDDLHDIYIIEKDIFAETYDEFK